MGTAIKPPPFSGSLGRLGGGRRGGRGMRLWAQRSQVNGIAEQGRQVK